MTFLIFGSSILPRVKIVWKMSLQVYNIDDDPQTPGQIVVTISIELSENHMPSLQKLQIQFVL